MRYIPFRTIFFSGLMVLGFFSCKPSQSSSEMGSSDSEVLGDGSYSGDVSFSLNDPNCPKPAQGGKQPDHPQAAT